MVRRPLQSYHTHLYNLQDWAQLLGLLGHHVAAFASQDDMGSKNSGRVKPSVSWTKHTAMASWKCALAKLDTHAATGHIIPAKSYRKKHDELIGLPTAPPSDIIKLHKNAC